MEEVISSTPRQTRVIDAFAASHLGYERKNQEDALRTDPKNGLFLIADGMGGHAGGEVASTLSVEETYKTLMQSGLGTDPKAALQRAFASANNVVIAHGNRNARLAGMGSTLVVAAHKGSALWIAHVGDSRAYLLRKGTITRLTRDHGDGNWISRAIGVSFGPGPDVAAVKIEPGDTVMLCTDGLTKTAGDFEMAQIMQNAKSCKMACNSLVNHALADGGPDNVSVIVVRF